MAAAAGHLNNLFNLLLKSTTTTEDPLNFDSLFNATEASNETTTLAAAVFVDGVLVQQDAATPLSGNITSATEDNPNMVSGLTPASWLALLIAMALFLAAFRAFICPKFCHSKVVRKWKMTKPWWKIPCLSFLQPRPEDRIVAELPVLDKTAMEQLKEIAVENRLKQAERIRQGIGPNSAQPNENSSAQTPPAVGTVRHISALVASAVGTARAVLPSTTSVQLALPASQWSDGDSGYQDGQESAGSSSTGQTSSDNTGAANGHSHCIASQPPNNSFVTLIPTSQPVPSLTPAPKISLVPKLGQHVHVVRIPIFSNFSPRRSRLGSAGDVSGSESIYSISSIRLSNLNTYRDGHEGVTSIAFEESNL